MSLVAEWQQAFCERLFLEFYRPVAILYSIPSSAVVALYPVRGFLFLYSNFAQLEPLVASVLLPYCMVHAYTYSILLGALSLNIYISCLILGPVGIQTGVISAICQCSSVNNYIYRKFVLPGKLDKVFDTSLCILGLDSVVVPGKLKRLVPKTLGSKVMDVNPITVGSQMVHLMYKVAVSFIPILGPLVLGYNKSIAFAMDTQSRFWKLTRMRDRQLKYYAKDHELNLVVFGTICQLLEAIPCLGLFFCFTNTCAAAMMAADDYKTQRGHPEVTQA